MIEFGYSKKAGVVSRNCLVGFNSAGNWRAASSHCYF